MGLLAVAESGSSSRPMRRGGGGWECGWERDARRRVEVRRIGVTRLAMENGLRWLRMSALAGGRVCGGEKSRDEVTYPSLGELAAELNGSSTILRGRLALPAYARAGDACGEGTAKPLLNVRGDGRA